MMQSSAAMGNSASSDSSPATLFCTECYYKPGSCGNEPGSPLRHLGTPLPSSPPLDSMNVPPPSSSLVRSLAQRHEEMKYLNMEVMNKSLRNSEGSLPSAPFKHTDTLVDKDNIRADLQIV
jgi:hypothetical protein